MSHTAQCLLLVLLQLGALSTRQQWSDTGASAVHVKQGLAPPSCITFTRCSSRVAFFFVIGARKQGDFTSTGTPALQSLDSDLFLAHTASRQHNCPSSGTLQICHALCAAPDCMHRPPLPHTIEALCLVHGHLSC